MKKHLRFISVYLRLWLFLKFHPVEELEASLWRIGCKVVVSRKSNIYHFPRGGKVIVSGDFVEVIPADAE